jgi:hypothetical protein
MKRILAVDIRSSRVGFAVVETPIRLLDWGKRALTADSCSALIGYLLRRYAITVLVVRGVAAGSPRDTVRVRKGLRAVRRIAHGRSVHFVAVSETTFKNVFRPYERRTKFEIAGLMTVVFPELSGLLPRPRRCYDPENRRMSAFEAIALAVAFLGRQPNNDHVHERLASAAGVLSAASR